MNFTQKLHDKKQSISRALRSRQNVKKSLRREKFAIKFSSS